MTTRPSPCSAFSRRALARISKREMPGVSSMKMGDSDRIPAPVVSFGQSESERYPVRSLWESTLATEHSIRCTSCSFDISRLKMATGMCSWTAACCAMFRQKLVLPMEGRPATTIRSDGCNPAVISSNLRNPVGTPVTWLFRS